MVLLTGDQMPGSIHFVEPTWFVHLFMQFATEAFKSRPAVLAASFMKASDKRTQNMEASSLVMGLELHD